MKTKFTTEEIKEWLEGWFIAGQYEDGRRKGLSLESILALLECQLLWAKAPELVISSC